MNTLIHSAGRMLAIVSLSVGLAVASVAQAQPEFVGPRNTIPRVQTRVHDRERDPLRASTQDAAACEVVRIEHKGHPGKGNDRVERIPTTCDRSRLASK